MDYEEEWEFLPDSTFLDFPENPDEKKIFSGKQSSSYPKSVFDMNYFMCPPESKKINETSSGNSSRKGLTKQLVPVPIQLEQVAIPKKGHQDPEADDDEVIKKPTAITEKIKGSINNNNIGSIEADQDAVLSQVFFKKMKENEFVDMKILDSSPKSPRNMNYIPQIDASAAGTFNDQPAIDNMTCSPRKKKIEDQVSWNREEGEEENGFGLNLWKLSLTGIGAICSFGVAAAAICVIIFGNQQKTKHHQQNQKHPFQIYSDDKRIKQVVQHATKLNEAISAVRGVPITRAHITYGGYYDAL